MTIDGFRGFAMVFIRFKPDAQLASLRKGLGAVSMITVG